MKITKNNQLFSLLLLNKNNIVFNGYHFKFKNI